MLRVTANLFVYGTLQPGLSPSFLFGIVDQFTLVGGGRTPGLLYDLGDYPGAIFDDAIRTEIHGVVYAVPDDRSIWEALDRYECVPSLYVRVRRIVTLDDNAQLDCWIYAYQQPVDMAKLIPSGRYRQ